MRRKTTILAAVLLIFAIVITPFSSTAAGSPLSPCLQYEDVDDCFAALSSSGLHGFHARIEPRCANSISGSHYVAQLVSEQIEKDYDPDNSHTGLFQVGFFQEGAYAHYHGLPGPSSSAIWYIQNPDTKQTTADKFQTGIPLGHYVYASVGYDGATDRYTTFGAAVDIPYFASDPDHIKLFTMVSAHSLGGIYIQEQDMSTPQLYSDFHGVQYLQSGWVTGTGSNAPVYHDDSVTGGLQGDPPRYNIYDNPSFYIGDYNACS